MSYSDRDGEETTIIPHIAIAYTFFNKKAIAYQLTLIFSLHSIQVLISVDIVRSR